MSEYEFAAELPWTLSPDEIEELRCFGVVEFTLRITGPSRTDVVRMLGDEFEWRGRDRSWWQEQLSRGKRTDAS